MVDIYFQLKFHKDYEEQYLYFSTAFQVSIKTLITLSTYNAIYIIIFMKCNLLFLVIRSKTFILGFLCVVLAIFTFHENRF